MGTYDTICFECPACGTELSGQSKSGSCILRFYNYDSVPKDVALDANRHAPFICDCGKKWQFSDLPNDSDIVFLKIEKVQSEDLCDIQDKKDELMEYADLANDEINEFCYILLHAADYSDYMSDEFKLHLAKEIIDQLKNFKENTRIVETEETYTQKFRNLEWL